MDLQQCWEMLEQKICPRCIDGDGRGACRLPAGTMCALKSYLPEIVASVATVKSDSIGSYIRALRNDVCTLCNHQAEDETCTKRTDLECALDRYYPLVVEIIETVSGAAHVVEAGPVLR